MHLYDPLHDSFIGQGEAYPESYWANTSDESSEDDGILTEDKDVEVAIIGAGYTGLSCALQLSRHHNIKPLVLEANQVAWGCSGRNAGFVLPSSGRMAFSQMTAKWGEEVMRGIHAEMQQGVSNIKAFIEEGVDCDVQPAGYLKLAHKPSELTKLIAQAELLKQTFNDQIEILSESDVKQNFMDDCNAYGGIRFTSGFGLHPLKLAKGIHKLARENGSRVHTGTPVISIDNEGKYQVLQTPRAKIRAKKVVIATNGYTPKGFHPLIKNRSLPVLSQIIVTEPLSDKQIEACNFMTSNVVMDTRALKYYYRKLPDNRILFGGRGAISGKSAEDPYYANRLLSVLKLSFPALTTLKIAYAWSGWICMSLDDIPHIYQNEDQTMFYGMGYCGSGVSFSTQMGKRIADKVVGLEVPNIPLYQTPLPKFPLAPLRRVGQWGYFQYGLVKDKWF